MVYMWRTIRTAIVLVALFSASEVYAQVADVDLTLSVDNTEATATLNIPNGVIEVLRLTAYDPDFVDEGQLFVNDQGPIDLFPGVSTANDGATLDIDIRLSDAQKAYFVSGNNTLRFTHVQTGGYGIVRIAAIGEVSVKEYAAITPDMSGDDVSANRTKALKIYKRLVGVTTPIDNPVLVAMEQQIDAGDLLAAAKIASDEPGFLNNVVRDMAAKMSTREETVKTALNDFTATLVGVVRDGGDARTLLTGNFYYMGGPGAAVPSNLVEDVLSSNDHYATLESDGYDLSSVLTLVSGQQVRSGAGTAVAHPDPAGVLTSRAFMEAHATAGTNRRLVEFTMKAFTCNDMEDWSDASAPDIKVGRDVDRFPGGDGAKFQTTCKACHAQMDGMRGAFARFDFSDGFTKYATLFNDGTGEDSMPQAPLGVSSKLNQNTDVFPAGHEVLDDSWTNYARSPANQQLFGWRGTVASGAGVGQFGTAVSNTQAFSKCMVKRVFREVCRRDPANFEIPAMESIANGFETQGYNLKLLFETVSVRPECAGL